MGGGGTIQQKLESNSAGSPFLLIHSIPGVGAQSSALAECYRVAGGASLAGWRDPRVPLQLVGASTTSNQPSLPPAGEKSGPTKLPTHLNQSSHPAEPVHCVKIQIKSNLWVRTDTETRRKRETVQCSLTSDLSNQSLKPWPFSCNYLINESKVLVPCLIP